MKYVAIIEIWWSHS